MANIPRGATPTFNFTFKDFDPTTAEDLIVTFVQQPYDEVLMEFHKSDCEVTSTTVAVWLSQEQSLKVFEGNAEVQINFLFADGQRAASTKKTIPWNRNLHQEVMR